LSAPTSERIEAARIRQALPNALLKVKVDRGETYLCVRRESLREVISLLKDDPELDYSYFSECLGVDYSRWPHERDLEERFEVVYNLMSLRGYTRIFVKVGVDDGQTVPSIKDIFLGAEYPERETADMFGIVFDGNPLKGRFLLPDDWIGFPLRKEYPLGGEDVNFAEGDRGPAVDKTGSDTVSGR
jgi:NADH-quinone oxidoreductase subunit C